MSATTATLRTASRSTAARVLLALLLGGAVVGVAGQHPWFTGAHRATAEGTPMPAVWGATAPDPVLGSRGENTVGWRLGAGSPAGA
jgi:hypothetical protein